MMIGTQEHYDLMAAFERDHRGYRLDRETKDLWPKGHVYQNGETNALFLAYRNGAAFAKAYHRDESSTPANPAQVTDALQSPFGVLTEELDGERAISNIESLNRAGWIITRTSDAIGAGGQAVAYQWRKRDRVMKHEEVWSYVDYHTGLKIAEHPEKYEVRPLYTHPAPSGQAVADGELRRYIEKCKELAANGEYAWWSRLAEILSALSNPPAQPGWRMVPEEPTEHMLREMAAASRDFLTETGTYPRSKMVYRAMLSAAPQPKGE